ncbi:hypothetical protein HYALB_00005142, partial [Hymenoscyphus albidus]
MSYLLWKYFHDDEIERFRKLLAHGHNNLPKNHGGGSAAVGLGLTGSPNGAYSTSPRVVKNNRKASAQGGNAGKGANQPLNRSDVNSRDYAGITLLGRIASSKSEGAVEFGLALIEHPAIDLYAQDTENGWTALHRALYFGNITLARAIIEKDSQNPSGLESSVQRGPLSVIKVKDHEGNSPFDVYNATIAKQSLQRGNLSADYDDDSQDEEESEDLKSGEDRHANFPLDGDEVFAWGSSKNYNLGLGDNDNRQYPERVSLKRPDHLLFRFFREYLETIRDTQDALYNRLASVNPRSVDDLPTLIANRPIVIRDVALSKMHSAILTEDPESNLFMCGFGQGGRLGTGDEITRFSYVCVEDGFSGKKIVQVALGNNHSLAIDSSGNVFAWGQNTNGVLGYSLPRPTLKDEDPISATPRQIFGPLKKEITVGVAASAIHSVAYTSTSLFTWGRNEGQLGLMDSDSRSLEVQVVPRRVAPSLFKAPIAMVSAINRATIVLLENHSVCVFANYGYKFLKFPPNEVFNNYGIQSNTLTTRYDTRADNITSITAAGDTIAAYSTESLFTVNVGAVDANSTTSTTNPSKIRDSLPDPQRVWSLRKGHWDGIKSASVTEDGSVIVCTQAGAVWRRVKRTKVKNAFAGTETFHRKDFKFQRVPGLANVAAVRSTAFGVYAAIRKDCDVTKTQISVNDQTLWEDLKPLLSLRDLEAPEPLSGVDTVSPRFWAPALPKDLLEPLKSAVLTSEDLEVDVSRHLIGHTGGYDMDIATTTSEISIPTHGFILGRSSVLRIALRIFRNNGQASVPDILVIQPALIGERPRIVFQGLDFISIAILVVYLYSDTVIDIWNYTRHLPKMAFRYRQIRIELMKTAAHLKTTKLESSVRLMTTPERRMDLDLGLAFDDPRFFDDADTIIELDDAEMAAHSPLLCRRCPFFDGLFNGRAGGQWLASRREDNSNIVRVDLKHIDPKAFRLVLRHLYTDIGTELFDHVVSSDLDEFSDLVMDVMATANELMIDRLSQICQEVLGRFVNVRNVCYLLNSVAFCSVAEFKDSALEYICLQLESLLENHWLNELDEELLEELDDVVRKNQLACLKYAKSGTFELMLHERNLDLVVDIEEERQRRIRDMAFRASLKNDDNRLSSSMRAGRIGSLDDSVVGSPSQEKKQRKAKTTRNEPFSPTIRPKDSTQDLMFDMEDDELLPSALPKIPTSTDSGNADNHDGPWEGREPRSLAEKEQLSYDHLASPSLGDKENKKSPSPAATKSWSSPPLPSSKLGLKEIMAQASSTRTSNLSMSLSIQKAREDSIKKESLSKLSQREKKQIQKAQQEAIAQPLIIVGKVGEKPSSPWQVAARGPKTSLKDVLSGEPTSSYLIAPSPKSLASPTPSREIRRTASPDTRFPGQQRSVSFSTLTKHSPVPGPSTQTYKKPEPPRPLVPHSKSYKTPTPQAEPALQLSMSDIIGQQRREQEVIKESVAKRSLQEIQEEQAFQEWWDQESKRAQELEAARVAKAGGSSTGTGSGTGSRRGGKGKGGRGRGDGGGGRGD